LADALAAVFATGGKDTWEAELSAADIGCVAVTEETAESVMQGDPYLDAGYAVLADSPIFEEHPRLAPLNRFSRSMTKADGGCLIGEHTDAVLRELGTDDDRIADLRARNIIA
jgi:crotonobetainyl-CoA:carnitine CoA-transferase CaiB-like acyl-CoA transferase